MPISSARAVFFLGSQGTTRASTTQPRALLTRGRGCVGSCAQDNARYRRLVGAQAAHLAAPLHHLFIAGCLELSESSPELLVDGTDKSAAGRVRARGCTHRTPSLTASRSPLPPAPCTPCTRTHHCRRHYLSSPTPGRPLNGRRPCALACEQARFAHEYWGRCAPLVECLLEGRCVARTRAELEAGHAAALRHYARTDRLAEGEDEEVLDVYDPGAGRGCSTPLGDLTPITVADLENGSSLLSRCARPVSAAGAPWCTHPPARPTGQARTGATLQRSTHDAASGSLAARQTNHR